MENKNYLMIQNNIVTNIVLWNGDTEQWNPPSDATMLIQETTPSVDWVWNSELKDYELVEDVGHGNIGDTWNGVACITTIPKPINPPSDPVTQSNGNIPVTTL